MGEGSGFKVRETGRTSRRLPRSREGAEFAGRTGGRPESEGGERRPADVGSDCIVEEYDCLYLLLDIPGLVADQHPCGAAVYTTQKTQMDPTMY